MIKTAEYYFIQVMPKAYEHLSFLTNAVQPLLSIHGEYSRFLVLLMSQR